MTIFNLISMIGGLTFFLYGMNVMSSSLEKMAGGRLEELLRKMTANPLMSLTLGAVITIAVQSSSAVTVMLVGLVNSGIMSFTQTVHVVFGSNIGTTLTAWLTSLTGIESSSFWMQMLKPINFSPILAFIGIGFIMLSKNDKKKTLGTIFVGFAILMFGMDVMSDAVSPLADMPEFGQLLIHFNNPIVGVIIGALFTGLIQSSAASVGILQALSLTGSITYGMAFPIVMGQNIGTCVTALISSIGTTTKAKRVAFLHIALNTICSIFCLIVMMAVQALVPAVDQLLGQAVKPWDIALLHTCFNIVATVTLMPFSKQLVWLVETVIKEKKGGAEPDDSKVPMLDDRLLRSPSVAVSESFNLSKEMCREANEIIQEAIVLFEHYDPAMESNILWLEDRLDDYEDQLGTYLVKLSSQALSNEDSQVVSKILHAIGDFERLGDHACNLAEVAKELYNKKIVFSPQAQQEIKVLTDALQEILTLTACAYDSNDVEVAARVEPLEQVIDGLISKIRANHIRRLQKGVCTIEGGFILADLLNNYERVSDHCSNIAVAIIEVEHNSFDTHKYLNGIKYGNSVFNEIYDKYEARYSL